MRMNEKAEQESELKQITIRYRQMKPKSIDDAIISFAAD